MKLVALIVWLMILLVPEASACSCLPKQAPCQAYWEASVVFAGTVNFSSTVTPKAGKYQFSSRLVRFTVDEAFRGLSGTKAEVMTGLGDADCGYGFRLGGQYLVYAYRQEDGKLYTGICSRTRPLSDATDDLAYMRGLGGAEPGGTIFGEVRSNVRADGSEARLKTSGVKIIVEGPSKRVEAVTDAKGRYRVSGLPPDTYKVTIEPPAQLSTHEREREAKVFDRGCAEISFWLETDPRTSGRVLDSEGQPAADVDNYR